MVAFATICTVRGTVTHGDPPILTFGLTALGLGSSGLVVLATTGGYVTSMFSLKILRLFGKYSYGLYLYHFPLSILLSQQRRYFVAATHSMIVGSVLFVVVALGVNLAVAIASFRLIESPILSLKSRFGYGTAQSVQADLQHENVKPTVAAAARA
jgi:peptidoglycan/LPS O-acetylase OafA/YrhL